MATEIIMPQLSDTMDEGTILTWLKKEGDTVDIGDEVAEVGTDKADLPVESFNAGMLLKIYAAEGTTVKVGEVIAVIGEAGESVPDSHTSSSTKAEAPEAAKPKEAASQAVASKPTSAKPASAPSAATNDQRVKISPLAKNLAQNHAVDVSSISGSGEGGRIVKKDIEAAIAAPASQPVAASAPQAKPAQASVALRATPAPLQAATQPLSRMRQTIAARMVEATTTIPHFYLTSAVDASSLKSVRASLKTLPEYDGVTFNHLIIKAVSLALNKFPRINSSYSEGNLIQPGSVNVGIITAVDDGLLIPVLKNVETLPLIDIVGESKALVSRARSGRPKGDDLVGATFCISNVGAFAVESFTAVISPGNGAILAVGAMQDEVVPVNGEAVIRPVMRLTLSVDHRIIDGVVGAQFLTELKGLIEDPVLLLA